MCIIPHNSPCRGCCSFEHKTLLLALRRGIYAVSLDSIWNCCGKEVLQTATDPFAVMRCLKFQSPRCTRYDIWIMHGQDEIINHVTVTITKCLATRSAWQINNNLAELFSIVTSTVVFLIGVSTRLVRES